MDDLARLFGEVRRVADHAVVEAGADGEQHVAVVHRHVGFEGAVHAGHAQVLAVAEGVAAQAHQGVGDRVAEQSRELGDLRGRVRQHDAAAGVDHRALGLEQQLHRLLDLPRVALDHRVVRAHRDLFRILELAAMHRHVLRDVDQHRAGAAGAGEVEGLLHRHRDVAHVLDEEVVLHARAGDTDGVDLLEGVLADGSRGHLAGDDHHRDRVAVGGGDAGDGVGGARAGGHHGDADLLGAAREAVGGVYRRLLVAHQHVADLVLLEERVVEEEDRAARVTEDILDLFFLQAPDYNFGSGQHHRELALLGF